jgi:hypothetical protein
MTFLAGATGDADTRADRVRFIAGAVATFALTEFFVVAANLRWTRDGFGGRNTALFGWNADAMFVF